MKRWVEKTAAESKNDFISYLNILWIPSAALSKWEMDFCSLLMKHQLVAGSFTKVFCLVSQAGSLLTWRRESLNEPCYDAALAPVLSPNWLTVPWLTRFRRRENKRIWWNVRTGRKRVMYSRLLILQMGKLRLFRGMGFPWSYSRFAMDLGPESESPDASCSVFYPPEEGVFPFFLCIPHSLCLGARHLCQTHIAFFVLLLLLFFSRR